MGDSWPWLVVAVLASGVAIASVRRQRRSDAQVAALQAQSRLLAQALDTARVSASHLDVRTGRLTRSSPHGPVGADLPPGAAGWEGLFQSLTAEERERILSYLRGVIARGEAEYHFEFAYTAEDGQARRMAVSGRIDRDATGEPLALAGVEQDVTERRLFEEQIQNAQRLESLGMLAGGIAHDFNNLVMGIMGGVAQLEPRLADDATALRALRLIDRGAGRAAELTQQLLAYAGRGAVQLVAIDVPQLVADLRPLLETSLGRRATLLLEAAPNVPFVRGAATQLRQVVMNLVLNAAEAMDRDGVVRVHVGRRDCDAAWLAGVWQGQGQGLVPGSYVAIAVTDTGCGMTPETRQRIFDPFFTTKFTGRGLGLAAVLGIVQRHGGAIAVDSTPGRGSTFMVILPIAEATQAAAALPPPGAVAAPAGGEVLVVDDEPMARDVAAEMLRLSGYTATAVASGGAALELLDADPTRFVAVLVDLTMPGLSGLETHREIRRRRATLPIVLMSGYSVDDARPALGDGEWTTFLQKPYRMVELRAALHACTAAREPGA
jgi:signal transduction histidine kinase/CheY-like chemotaxis protein